MTAFKKSFAKRVAANARLIILQALEGERDRCLNDSLIAQALELMGHKTSQDKTRTFLRKLEELAAVEITDLGSTWMVKVTRAGIDHVQSRSVIETVELPDEED